MRHFWQNQLSQIKNSYEGTGTIYTNESNYNNESTTKQTVTKSKQQPSQAAIVTTTTIVTTTPLQKQYNSGKHENPVSRSKCYENVTQKRKWAIREYNRSKDLNLSEIKDTEELKADTNMDNSMCLIRNSSKYYQNKHNSSIELEKKSSQKLINNDKTNIYKTQERISKNDSSFRDSDNFNLLGTSATLKRKQWKIKYSLKSHLDSVRSWYFNMHLNILASASEDKTVRLWKADSFSDDKDNVSEQIFSYMTLRGHKGALLAMSGPGDSNFNSKRDMLYTAGEEGEIRVWKIPNPIYSDTIESTHDTQHCLAVWKYHSDTIWDLQHHPSESCLLSLSADNEIALWMTITDDENIESLSQGDFGGNIRHTFKNKELFSKYHDTPTTCWWLGEDTPNFISGFVSPNIIMFDANTGTKKSSIKFETQDFKTMEQQQPNKIIWNNMLNLVISGHEDKEIKLFDLRSNSCVKSFVGHTDSVSALANSYDGNHLISGGHDGNLRWWDIRKLTQQCLYDIPAHRKKYDEGINFIATHPAGNIFASCGADSIIKIFVAPHLDSPEIDSDLTYQHSLSFKR